MIEPITLSISLVDEVIQLSIVLSTTITITTGGASADWIHGSDTFQTA